MTYDQDRYFEDFEVGDRVISHGYTFTEANIIAFAQQYDPQPFHMDVEAAKKTVYGGLIASGWQTGSVMFRLLYDTGFMRGGSMGSNGTDHMKWLAPVRPGDTVHVEVEVLDKRESSRRDRGYLGFLWKTLNQHGEVVLEMRSKQIIATRPKA